MKKRSIFKKLAVFAAGAMLVMGMSASAFAAGQIDGTHNAVETSDTTLNIEKTLKVTNQALDKVAGPGLELTYTVAPTPASDIHSATVTDSNNHSANVKTGPADGLAVTSTPNFTKASQLDASAAGADNKQNIVLDVDLTKFQSPGIYRYTLTDTTSADALQAAGVEARSADFNNVRYVDVYITRDANDALVVSGYVVGSDVDGNGILVKETFDTTTKSDQPQIEDPENPGQMIDTPAAAATPDVFNTYNMTLTKQVTGTMGDKNNEFPFAIALSDGGRAFYAAKTTAPAAGAALNQNAGTTSLSTNLKHTEVYHIAGLTKNDTVNYTETNNTADTYSVAITGGTASAASDVAAGATKAMGVTNVTNAGAVTFTNNFDSVSPTGVVMQYGVAIALLFAGLAFAVVYRRKRAADMQ